MGKKTADLARGFRKATRIPTFPALLTVQFANETLLARHVAVRDGRKGRWWEKPKKPQRAADCLGANLEIQNSLGAVVETVSV